MPFTEKTTLNHGNPPNIAWSRPLFSDAGKKSERASNKQIKIQCSKPPPPDNSPVCSNLALPNTDTHLISQLLRHLHPPPRINFRNLPSVINYPLTDGNCHESETTEHNQNYNPFRCAPNTAMRSFPHRPSDLHYTKTTTASNNIQESAPTSRMKGDIETLETCCTYDKVNRQSEKIVSDKLRQSLKHASSAFLSSSVTEILERLYSGNETEKTGRESMIDIGINTIGSCMHSLLSQPTDAQCISPAQLVAPVLTNIAHTLNSDTSKLTIGQVIGLFACDVAPSALQQLFESLNGKFFTVVLSTAADSVKALIREISIEKTRWSETLLQFIADLIVNIGSYGAAHLTGIILGAICLPTMAAQILIPVATAIVRWGVKKALEKVCECALTQIAKWHQSYPDQTDLRNQNDLVSNSSDESPQLKHSSSSSSPSSSSSSSPSSSSSSPPSGHLQGENVSVDPYENAVCPKTSREQIYDKFRWIDEDSPEDCGKPAENTKSRSNDGKRKRRRSRTTAAADQQRRVTTQQWHRFGDKQDTRSETARAAHRLAKDQNRVPRSAQPEEVTWVDDRNPEAKTYKNPQPKVRLYRYKNVDGHDIYIRHDTPRTYANECGSGAQGSHINAGSNPKKLRQHHLYGEQPGDNNVKNK